MAAFACNVPRLVRFSWLSHLVVKLVQAQCCSDDAGLSLTLLFHDICPQTLTIVKISDVVATSSPLLYIPPLHTSDNPSVHEFLQNTETLYVADSFCHGASTGNCCIMGLKRSRDTHVQYWLSMIVSPFLDINTLLHYYVLIISFIFYLISFIPITVFS